MNSEAITPRPLAKNDRLIWRGVFARVRRVAKDGSWADLKCNTIPDVDSTPGWTKRQRMPLAEGFELACLLCKTVAAVGACCSSHNKQLCHRCYRRAHFVEVCTEGCANCAREGLSVNLYDQAAGGSRG
jgi:hypothetical protein